jgi:hypothetical protein
MARHGGIPLYPSIREQEAGGSEFKASLVYIARSCLKKQTNKKNQPAFKRKFQASPEPSYLRL